MILWLVPILVVLYFIIGYRFLSVQPNKIINEYKSLLLYLFFVPVSIFFSFFNNNKKIYLCLTIDGDLTSNEKANLVSIQRCFLLLDKLGLKNKSTWFVNNEHKWTTTYSKELLHIAKNYDLQLHSHFIEGYWAKNKKIPGAELIYTNIKKEKNDIEHFLMRYNIVTNIIAFRAGVHMLTDETYSVLERLEFKIDSSQMPGKCVKYPNGTSYDFTNISAYKNVYSEGNLVILPTYNKIPGVTLFNTVNKVNGDTVFLTFLFHPFELIKNPDSDNWKFDWLKYLGLYLIFILNRLHYHKGKWISVKDILKYI